jgi:hypothetical protein
MRILKLFLISLTLFISTCYSQKRDQSFISFENLSFLELMTKDVLDASRIYPGQTISKDFGPNNTGGILIRPGGRDDYPCFWIRDYAMSLETGFVSKEEQLHMLMLTASTQCDQSFILKGGSLIPVGSIADHIRIDDSKPIYFPGTESYEEQGTKEWGTIPPYCDEFYFVHMAYCYVRNSSDRNFLLREINGKKMIDRLVAAFHEPPVNPANNIVYASDEVRGIDFGFRDVITITGNLCFPSILRYQAAKELAVMLDMTGSREADGYKQIASSIKKAIPGLFADSRGMLKASTGKSNQPDVWSTAYAVYLGILENKDLENACHVLDESYKAGTLSYKGNIRHVLTIDDYNSKTAWEISMADKNTYQNGAYWGTPTGWVCYSIKKVDAVAAASLANEFIADLRENDFRKGIDFGAPYECINKNGYKQNPLYLATVACPLIAFRRIEHNR